MNEVQADSMIAAIDRLSTVAHFIFDIPTAENLGYVFFIGFSLPATCYLVGWAVGSIANFINKY